MVRVEEIRKGSVVEIQGKNNEIISVDYDAHSFNLYTPYAGYISFPMDYITKVVRF